MRAYDSVEPSDARLGIRLIEPSIGVEDHVDRRHHKGIRMGGAIEGSETQPVIVSCRLGRPSVCCTSPPGQVATALERPYPPNCSHIAPGKAAPAGCRRRSTAEPKHDEPNGNMASLTAPAHRALAKLGSAWRILSIA